MKTKIALLTPTRGDRPQLLKKCKEMMIAQSHSFDFWEIVNYKPKGGKKDLVERVKAGVETILSQGAKYDLIFIIEDDDFYHKDYLFRMVKRWKSVGKPDLFGIGESTYYHIKTNKYWHKYHPKHASLMNTAFTPRLASIIKWEKVKDIFLDVYLWQAFKGVSTRFDNKISLGIKHGIGLTGGIGHNQNASIYQNVDESGEFLKSIVGNYYYKFYRSLPL